MKLNWEYIFWYSLGAGVMILQIFCIYWLIGSIIDTSKLDGKCKKECAIYVSKVIDDKCYCADQDGWVESALSKER